METVRIDGLDDSLAVLNQIKRDFPKRVVTAGMRRATRPFTRELKRVAPAREIGRIVKVKAYTKGKSPVIGVGAFHSPKSKSYGTTSRTGIPYWYIWYWTDYGTLSRRHPGHAFVRPRKRVSQRWSGGVRPRLSVERAWSSSRSQVIANMPTALREEARKYVERNFDKT